MAAHKNEGSGMVVGMAAAVAAAAGAYWLYGSKHASKHRKLARSWMLKARAEVLDRVEVADMLNKDTYLNIVNDVMKGYAKAKDVTSEQVAQATKDLTSAWAHMQKVYKENMPKTPKKVGKKSSRAKK